MLLQKLTEKLGGYDVVGYASPASDTSGLLIAVNLEEIHNKFESRMRTSDGRINRVHLSPCPSSCVSYVYQVLDTAVRLTKLNFEASPNYLNITELRIFHRDALKRQETLNYLHHIFGE